MSLPETLLWQRLRRRSGGAKFRRQHPIDFYVADFYCAAARLVIEIDGTSHGFGTRPARDVAPDAFLAVRGLTIPHIPAGEVLRDPDAAADAIVRAALPLHPAAARRGPPPHARHGEDQVVGVR